MSFTASRSPPYFFNVYNGISKYVAPYFADADIRKSGEVFFRRTTDPSLLQRANSEIRTAFPDYQNIAMQSLLIATWYRVGFYSRSEVESNKVCIIYYCVYSVLQCLSISNN